MGIISLIMGLYYMDEIWYLPVVEPWEINSHEILPLILQYDMTIYKQYSHMLFNLIWYDYL